MTKRTPPFSPVVRERAVRMVQDHKGEHNSLHAATQSIAAKIGCSGKPCAPTTPSLRPPRWPRRNQANQPPRNPGRFMSMMGATARDAENNARWRTATAVKDGSDSVKNLLASLDSVKGSHAGPVTLGMVAVEAISQGLEHAGPKGAAYAGSATAGAYLVNTLRQAGIKRTADLYREAMANPELARALMSKMPTSADVGVLHTVARVLRRNLITGPMLTSHSQPAMRAPAPTLERRGGALSALVGGSRACPGARGEQGRRCRPEAG